MRQLLSIILLFFTINCYCQTTTYVDFDISFPLEINDKPCSDYGTDIKQDSLNIDFYFIYHISSIHSTVRHNKNDNSFNIKGRYTHFKGAGYFYPIIVINVKPVFRKLEYCNSRAFTYLIDLQNLNLKRGTVSDSLSVTIDKIQLHDNPYITILADGKAMYETFPGERIVFFLKQFFLYWHLIKKIE